MVLTQKMWYDFYCMFGLTLWLVPSLLRWTSLITFPVHLLGPLRSKDGTFLASVQLNGESFWFPSRPLTTWNLCDFLFQKLAIQKRLTDFRPNPAFVFFCLVWFKVDSWAWGSQQPFQLQLMQLFIPRPVMKRNTWIPSVQLGVKSRNSSPVRLWTFDILGFHLISPGGALGMMQTLGSARRNQRTKFFRSVELLGLLITY